jgi:DnaA N-terminal domain
VAYYRIFAELAGKTSAGVMLSQAWYWTSKTDDEDGWFYKTRDEWWEETGMTRTEQETARRRLVERGLLEEKLRGMPGKLHFRVNVERLISLLVENPPTGRRKTYQQAGRISADSLVENPPTTIKDPETTAEITSETTTEISIDVVLTTNAEINAANRRLFKFWQETFVDVPGVDVAQTKLTKGLRAHMTARFRSDCHWTERQLRETILGMRRTPYNLGKNDTGTLYVSLSTCFRNDERTDRYRQVYLASQREAEARPPAIPEDPNCKLCAGTGKRKMKPATPQGLQPPNGEWSRLDASMREQLQPSTFQTWWKQIECVGLKHAGPKTFFWLRCENPIAKDWILNHYGAQLEAACMSAELGDSKQVSFYWLVTLEQPCTHERKN